MLTGRIRWTNAGNATLKVVRAGSSGSMAGGFLSRILVSRAQIPARQILCAVKILRKQGFIQSAGLATRLQVSGMQLTKQVFK
jgi:hypothetical protein